MCRGITLIEIVIALAILGIMTAVALPSLNSILTGSALDAAASEFHAVLFECRNRAITRNVNVGVKFIFENGELLYGVFVDGNHNGIRSAEIEDGTDPPVRPFTPIRFSAGRIRPGILDATIPDIFDGGRIDHPEDPVKFGRGNICSFSPLGKSTPGTLYLTDGRNLQAAVRVYPRGALTRILLYRPERGWYRIRQY